MRKFLLFLGWAGMIGAVLDGAITGFAAWLVFAAGAEPLALTVDAHLRDHLSFVYWIKDLAFFILPDRFVVWLFDLPALVYFPVRIVVNLALGVWMLALARRMAENARTAQ